VNEGIIGSGARLRSDGLKTAFGVVKPGVEVAAGRPIRWRGGFTLAELAITMTAAVIVVLALGTAIAEGIRGWQRMYGRIYADVVTDSYVARKTFDSIVRKSSRLVYLVDEEGRWLETYYHSRESSGLLDRYARFYVEDDKLFVEHGRWTLGADTAKEPLRTVLVCSNVASCIFRADRRSAQMLLRLDDGSQEVVVACSAVMHSRF